MSTYNYICKKCGKEFIVVCPMSKINEEKPKICDECGGEVDMNISKIGKIGIQWKCDGAYGKGK